MTASFLTRISILTSFLFATAAWAHPTQNQLVEIEPENGAVWSAGPATFNFQLIDTKTNFLVTDKDLDIVHEKKLHFLVYDESLKEFFHLHPVFNGTVWTVDTDVLRNGKYWIWAQGTLTAGTTEFSSSYQVQVNNGTTAWPTPATLTEVRTGLDGNSVVTLANTKLKAGKMAMLDMVFSRTDGTTPDITPYLGAIAHIVAVPDDGDSLIHVHPMAGSKPSEGMIHVTFPAKGMYRIWVQFIDGAKIRTIPLAVKVQ